MTFDANFLGITGWTLTKASISGTSLVLLAGGTATKTFTEINNTNLLSEQLKLIIVATTYPATYQPSVFATVRIVYDDGTIYESMSPIVDLGGGEFSVILYPTEVQLDGLDASAFTSLTVTFSSGIATTLTTWELCQSLNNSITTSTSYYGFTVTASEGLKITKTDQTARAVFNAETIALQKGNGSGSWTNALFFDATKGEYVFNGSVVIKDGSININDNFIVDSEGNARLSGDATMYGGKFYAGTPEANEGYVEMTSSGFKVYNAAGLLKIKIGYTTDGYDYPFIRLSSGSGSESSWGLFKKFTNGLWIGNSAPMEATGNFVAASGYNGIFHNFDDNVTYVVSGTNMQNVYTGEAIAKFG